MNKMNEIIELEDIYEDDLETCPYCGSNCLVDYEYDYEDESEVEFDCEYSCHCTVCGRDF